MDWTTILGTVWSVINSPAGITVMASVVIYVLNKLYTAKPALAAYEGTLIAEAVAQTAHADDGFLAAHIQPIRSKNTAKNASRTMTRKIA